MMRRFVSALAVAAMILVVAGCKDDRPSSAKFDPSKANYTAGQGQYKGGMKEGETTKKEP